MLSLRNRVSTDLKKTVPAPRFGIGWGTAAETPKSHHKYTLSYLKPWSGFSDHQITTILRAQLDLWHTPAYSYTISKPRPLRAGATPHRANTRPANPKGHPPSTECRWCTKAGTVQHLLSTTKNGPAEHHPQTLIDANNGRHNDGLITLRCALEDNGWTVIAEEGKVQDGFTQHLVARAISRLQALSTIDAGVRRPAGDTAAPRHHYKPDLVITHPDNPNRIHIVDITYRSDEWLIREDEFDPSIRTHRRRPQPPSEGEPDSGTARWDKQGRRIAPPYNGDKDDIRGEDLPVDFISGKRRRHCPKTGRNLKTTTPPGLNPRAGYLERYKELQAKIIELSPPANTWHPISVIAIGTRGYVPEATIHALNTTLKPGARKASTLLVGLVRHAFKAALKVHTAAFR